MGKKTPKPDVAARRRPNHPDLRKATPEALAKALLRPKKPADPSLRVVAPEGRLKEAVKADAARGRLAGRVSRIFPEITLATEDGKE